LLSNAFRAPTRREAAPLLSKTGIDGSIACTLAGQDLNKQALCVPGTGKEETEA